jgi:serine/threonine-protein kinase
MPAENLSHYRVLKKLGAGKSGEVYLAQDTTLGRTVALKILRNSIARDPDLMERFLQEAKTASTLDHPNVAHIYEVGEAGGDRFIAMQFVEGETLQHRIKKSPLSVSEILNIGIQIADALEEAHSKGISHGELNASNVMLTSRGPVKVLDFGVAKVWNVAELDSTLTSSPEVTTRSADSDALQYLSPEQTAAKQISRRSDVYSLGVILYQMSTARLPFPSGSRNETLKKISQDQVESISRFNHRAPAELDRIIHKCMEKDPGYRYPSARDLLVDLKNLQRDYESGTAMMAGSRRSLSLPSKRYILILLMIVLLALGFFIYKYATRSQKIHSLAVLPFVNINADPDLDYLSDGITESTINSLSQLPNIKVLARGTVFTYKGKPVDPRSAGRDLNVDAVVTGSIQQQGDTLIVQSNLVDTKDGAQIWGERYNRPQKDLLSVQTEISKEISRNLRLTLTGNQEEQLNRTYTKDTEAYQLFLRGRYYLNMRTQDGFNRAIDSFQKAIQRDPDFALAYAGLADAYALLSNWGFLPSIEGYPKAKAASLKALQLDDSLAEAYTSLGSIQSSYDWNWQEAEKSFRQAISINPNLANAHHWYSFYLSTTGRHEEALVEMQEALQLDPLSMIINANMGYTLYVARKYNQALDQLKKTIELDPNFAITYQYLGYTYEQMGKFDQALQSLKKATALDPDSLTFQADLASAYALAGKKQEAEKILDDLMKISRERYVSPFDIANIYAGLEDNEKAIEWLYRAYDLHSDVISYIKMDPRMDSLRSDPRFQELLRRIHLN